MIKKLITRVREYKKDTILAPLFVTAESLLEILIPTLMAFLIDEGINKKDIKNMFLYGGLLLLSAALSLVTGYFAGRSAAVASSGFAKNLRKDMYYSIQNFSFSNIDKFSTAGLITRLTTDVTNVQNAFQMMVRLGFRAPLIIVFALIFSFRIDAKLSLIFLGCIPILGVGLWLIIYKVHPIFVRVFKTYDRLNNVVQENLYGIKTVKSFNRENNEEKKFADISEDIYQDFSKAEKRLAFNMPLMQFCVYACMLLLSWFGAKAIIASGDNAEIGLSTGELTSLITYTIQILMSLMMLSMVFVMVIISRASAERIVETLEEKSDIVSPINPIKEVKDGSISFEDVTFFYNKNSDKPVLSGVNLDIKSGQTVGILGGTGSSKSSIVQLIPRLYDTTKGTIKVGGKDVKEYDLEVLRDNVSMVLQKNVLFSGTIAENLRWGNENATDAELINACKIAQADDFINELEDKYNSHIEQGGANVSGGQRQRLCIARALLKNPKVIILDDSTSAVDTKTEKNIRDGFKSFIPGVTKLIIAQRISSVMEADKIIVMDDGKISAVGTHQELLKSSDIYKEVFESQQNGVQK